MFPSASSPAPSSPAARAGAPHSRRPLDESTWRRCLPRGQVRLILDRCKGCRLCVELCPQQMLVLSDGMNVKGYHYPVVAPGKAESCVACGFCTLICPEFAIFADEVGSSERSAI